MYLLEDLTQSCYKESSDSLRLLPFDAILHDELRQFYQFLGSGDKSSLQGSSAVSWSTLESSSSASPGSPLQSSTSRLAPMRLRVTNLIGANGQSVFYIRRYRQAVASLAELGVPKAMAERLLSPSLTGGLLMLVGSPGSGKTTLANSIICERLTRWGGVCVTAENPVELDIAGRHGLGMCFAHEVSSDEEMAGAVIQFMRTSPNLIFLGEIRDAFVARQATLAALSGQLVVTTFHGPSVVGALARFAGLVGDDHLLADALSAVGFLELSQLKDSSKAFDLTPRTQEPHASLANRHSMIHRKKLTMDLLWFLGEEGAALSSIIRSGNFAMLSSEITRQRNAMLQHHSLAPKAFLQALEEGSK